MTFFGDLFTGRIVSDATGSRKRLFTVIHLVGNDTFTRVRSGVAGEFLQRLSLGDKLAPRVFDLFLPDRRLW